MLPGLRLGVGDGDGEAEGGGLAPAIAGIPPFVLQAESGTPIQTAAKRTKAIRSIGIAGGSTPMAQ